MHNKPITYGAIGFVLGVVLVIGIGLIGMSGMMWFGGRYSNCNYPQLPQNPGSTK
jgi:hypothetical protein